MPPSLTGVVQRSRGHPTPTLLRGHEGSLAFVAFLSDDQIISASDEDMTVRRWHLSNGRSKVVKELLVCTVAVAPNKRWVAFGGRDGRIRLMDLETSSRDVNKSVARHTDVITSVSFSPDSSQLASGAEDGRLLVWSATTLEHVVSPIKGHKGSVWCLCYSPDGNKFASCDRETIQIWSANATSGWVGLNINEQAWSLAWSSDCNNLFVGCIDGSIKRYNPHTGARHASYAAHSDVVSSIVLSRDAKFVATASWDKTVRLWEATTFQQIGPMLPHDTAVYSVSISPDARHLVSGARDSNVRVWNLRNIAPVLFSFFPLEPNRGPKRNGFHLPWVKSTRDLDLSSDQHEPDTPRARIQIPADGSEESPEFTIPTSSKSLPTPGRDILKKLVRERSATINFPRTPASSAKGSSIGHGDFESLGSASSRNLLSPTSPVISPVISRRQMSEIEDRDFIKEIRSDPTHDLTGRIVPEGRNLVSGGSHGDIYKGTLSMNGKVMQVAIKVIKKCTARGNVHCKKRRLRQEIERWLMLDHKNVLPMLGTTDDYGNFPAMVFPWIEKGTLTEFLERRNDDLTTLLRFCIINDVALGLQHLHYKSIVHGNISGSNVFIYGNGRACVADFGLLVVLAELEGSSLALTYQTNPTIRWTAPELLDFREDTQECGDSPVIFPTAQSDIYSFAGIMLHTLTGKQPYHGYPHDEQVMVALSRGELPQFPPSTAVVTNDQWDFMMRCWSVEAAERPCDSEVVSFVHEQLLDAVVSSGEAMLRICEAMREDDQTTTSSGSKGEVLFGLYANRSWDSRQS